MPAEATLQSRCPAALRSLDEAIGLNFTAARRLAESALPAMRRARWGRIITITGSLALKRMNAATPAKAAITSWSRALSIQVEALWTEIVARTGAVQKEAAQ